MRRKRKGIGLLLVSLLSAVLLCPAYAVEPVESDFFTDTIGSVDQIVNLVTDYGADGSDNNDDSAALQTAVDDMTALPNGGKIIIPSGTFYFDSIYLKSNVHLEIDSGATIKPSDIPTGNYSIFKMVHGWGADELITVQNVSVRGSGGRFTVDLRNVSNQNVNFITTLNVDNFLISDVTILDEFTEFSAIMNNLAEDNGQYGWSRNGVIKNVACTEGGHYGYGTVQMQVGTHILFKNLAGVGGATLRLESGAVDTAHARDVIIDDVWGRDISCTNGRCAVMISPHSKANGHVDVARVTSDSCGFAVTIEGGYIDVRYPQYPEGTYADTCVVDDVYAVYGTTAQLKLKHDQYIPCAIRDQIADTPFSWSSSVFQSPAGVNTIYDADPNDLTGDDPGDYLVTISNLTQDGFDHVFKPLLNKDDEVDTCNAVPVTGIAVSPATSTVEVNSTVQLSASVTPVDATDQSVTWTSDDPAVATVSSSGLVTGMSEGTAVIAGTATDGGYTDFCTVTVSGTAAAWNTFTSDDFESGLGNWVSGGVDAFLSSDYAIGTQCVNLQDNTGDSASIWLANSLDLSGSNELKVEFTYMPISMDSATEDFWLQYSDDGGSSWTTIKAFVTDVDYVNGTREDPVIVVDSAAINFTSNAKLRFQCDASGDADDIYIDNVIISARGGTPPVNNAPAFDSDPVVEADATENEAYSSTIADDASDSDGDSLSFSATAGPSWLTVAVNGDLSGTPSNSDLGLNSWMVEVNDGKGGTDSATLELTVAEAGPVLPDTADADLPVLGTVSGSYVDTQAQDDVYQSITEVYSGLKSQIDHVWEFNLGAGNSLFKVDAYYADSGDTDSGFTFSWGTDPAGPWTEMLTVTKTADNDSYQQYDMGSASGTIYIRVEDNDRTRKESGLDTLYVDHMVIEAGGGVVNNDPSFDSDPVVEVNATENAAYSASIADDASDPDSDPLTFSKVSGPAWLSVASDGSLSGTPAASDVGLNSFTVELDDGNGGLASATLEITVDAESGGDPLPGEASSPTPVHGARNVPVTGTVLSWTAGSDAVSHNVYFGTTSGSLTLMGNQTGTTFDPGTLVNKEVYYWRIDEVNAAGTTTGTEWKFTTVR